MVRLLRLAVWHIEHRATSSIEPGELIVCLCPWSCLCAVPCLLLVCARWHRYTTAPGIRAAFLSKELSKAAEDGVVAQEFWESLDQAGRDQVRRCAIACSSCLASVVSSHMHTHAPWLGSWLHVFGGGGVGLVGLGVVWFGLVWGWVLFAGRYNRSRKPPDGTGMCVAQRNTTSSVWQTAQRKTPPTRSSPTSFCGSAVPPPPKSGTSSSSAWRVVVVVVVVPNHTTTRSIALWRHTGPARQVDRSPVATAASFKPAYATQQVSFWCRRACVPCLCQCVSVLVCVCASVSVPVCECVVCPSMSVW